MEQMYTMHLLVAYNENTRITSMLFLPKMHNVDLIHKEELDTNGNIPTQTQ